MRYLLDTCVLSEVIKSTPEEAVLRWLDEQEENRLFLSVLVLGEIRKGIEKLPDSRRKRELHSWLHRDLQERFAGRIWEINEAVALTWGRLQGQAEAQGRKLPIMDGLLAATALEQNAILVTRNVVDFEVEGLEVFNPWPVGS